MTNSYFIVTLISRFPLPLSRLPPPLLTTKNGTELLRLFRFFYAITGALISRRPLSIKTAPPFGRAIWACSKA